MLKYSNLLSNDTIAPAMDIFTDTLNIRLVSSWLSIIPIHNVKLLMAKRANLTFQAEVYLHKLYNVSTVISWKQCVQRKIMNVMDFTQILSLVILGGFYTSINSNRERTYGHREAAGGERRWSECSDRGLCVSLCVTGIIWFQIIHARKFYLNGGLVLTY